MTTEHAAGSHPRERLVHQLLVKGEGVVERDVGVADQRKPAWRNGEHQKHSVEWQKKQGLHKTSGHECCR